MSGRHVLVLIVMCLGSALGNAWCSRECRAQVPESEIRALQNDAELGRNTPKPAKPSPKQADIDFLSLLFKGGIFMIPIGCVSLLVVTFAIDRWIGLRSGKLLPRDFRKSLSNMIRSGDVCDPRDMYRLCTQSNSAASAIASAAISRAGRPQSEILSEVAEATQRQVDRAYGNVRWLNLAAGIAPLLGLLGTVWGLIRAFHDTTQLTAGQNRADFLAVGIYEALVTTLAGLIVAIPAAIASHYFEGRITRVFGNIEDLMSDLVRSLERFEGKTRFDIIGRELSPRDIVGSVIPPPIATGGHAASNVGDSIMRSKASRTATNS